jgi:hypothetical protein
MLFSLCLTGIGLYSEISRNRPAPVPDFSQIVGYIDEPILKSVRQCASYAEGAASNTHDPRGCLAAAGTAGTYGRNAENQVNSLKRQIQNLASKP